MMLLRGAGWGATAYVLGYLVTWILAGTRAANATDWWPLGGSIPEWKAVLWVFYDAHFVGTRTPEIVGPGGNVWAGGDLIDTVGLLGVEYLYAVPVLALLAVGARAAMLAGAATPREGLMAGTTVAIGYLALVVAGLFAGSHGGIAPSPLRALAIAGVVYPVAFGGIGGAVAGLYRRNAGSGDGGPVG